MPVGDKSKLRKFAASIPRDKVPDLIPCTTTKFSLIAYITTKLSCIPCITAKSRDLKIVLQEPLRILLKSCAASTTVAAPDEEVRRCSLLVCLDAIRNIAKEPSVPDFNYVRANFANISLMRAWLDSSDTPIRVASRSICALLAKQLIREQWLEEPQLRWLQEVTGWRAIYSANSETKNHMNLKSFVNGVLSNQEGNLPTEDLKTFKETLAILLDVGSDAHFAETDIQSRQRLSEEVGWIHHDNPEGSGDVVDKLRAMFPFLPEHFPEPHSVYY
jgi:hypothetical protein